MRARAGCWLPGACRGVRSFAAGGPDTRPRAAPTPCLAVPRRYHYNVANNRVQQHVEKGNDDGLYISSVACCQDLWALIMDAGTGFAQQVYDLSSQVRALAGAAGDGQATGGRRHVRGAGRLPAPAC